jgi:2-polyprenyl-6-methoxyphenol hydroxylase-like FAD-dependent oxidoreductase
MDNSYDAIVIGARCAGSTTAMLLARKGFRVLVADRAAFPSDTLSTHIIHAPGVAALSRWGLLDRVVATGCPPIESYSFNFGPFTIAGTPRPADAGSTAYAPRRTVLDKILVDAAAEAGAEVREQYNVDDLVVEDGTVVGVSGHGQGGEVEVLRARVVIGADGRNSHVARSVAASGYHEKPRLQWSYYSYFSGLPLDGFETYARPHRGWAAAETNDGLTMLVVARPYAEARDYKADVETNYFATLDLVPEFAARVKDAKREEPFLGGAVPNFFHTPYGPGWALVGDAGYNKDPITAQGITDAFRDAEQCSTAVDDWLHDRSGYDEAMDAWQQARDAAVLPVFEFTTELATLEPLPPEMLQVLGAVHGNSEAMDDFVSLTAGTVSPAAFFAPENIDRIMRAHARQG